MKSDRSWGMTSRLLTAVSLVLVCVLIVQVLFWAGVFRKPEETAPAISYDAAGRLSRDGYTLEQAVILSRHNIRSP